MDEVLQSLCGKYKVFSKYDLAYFATCAYRNIRHHGDPALWWLKDKHLYEGHTTCRYGTPHFWKRINVKEEDDEIISQNKRAKKEEKKVIDLTQVKDV
jgi:hypothetical protein